MTITRNIWVLPEIDGRDSEISKLSLGLLSEARRIAERSSGIVTAVLLGDDLEDHSDTFSQYGIAKTYLFKDPLLQYFTAEAFSAALLPEAQKENPWLVFMGHTKIGKELAPRLASLLNTGVISNCVRMDLSQSDRPKFYRSVFADQLYQEVVFQSGLTMIVTMNPSVLDIQRSTTTVEVETRIIESNLSPDLLKTRHQEYLTTDLKSMDIADAKAIVAAGMGAATDDLLPLVEELTALIGSTIGATRPVVDEGKISKERMIGQTGKTVSPDFYLALGISGATHHVGGIRESGKIFSINRDPQAPIFQNSDVGVIAELREVLPKLIERIKRAKSNGEIL